MTDETRHVYVPGLDVLRAIAVLLTFAMHFAWLYGALFLGVDLESKYLPDATGIESAVVIWLHYSLHGVFLFFMISGYLIGRLWLRDSPPQLSHYLWQRCKRIFPAFWAALLGAWLLAAWRGGAATATKMQDVLLNATLLNWFNPAASPPWLIPSWSLQVEWLFYLTIPLLALLLRGKSFKSSLATLLIIAVLVAAGLKGLGERHFAYPLFFAVGIVVAMLGNAKPEKFARLAARLPRWLPWLLLFALLLGYAALEPIGRVKPAWGFTVFDLFALAFVPVGGVFFVSVGFAANRRVMPRGLYWLGRVSYSFYLWHLIVLIALFDVAAKVPAARETLMQLPWGVRATLLCAAGFAL